MEEQGVPSDRLHERCLPPRRHHARVTAAARISHFLGASQPDKIVCEEAPVTTTSSINTEPIRNAPTSSASSSTALTPCLWFDKEGEEAAAFYTSIFKDSRIGRITRFNGTGSGRPGEAIMVEFELNGQRFVALNGGPQIYFNEAISFQVFCAGQDEVDYYWDGLSEDGKQGRRGWLQDRYGLFWQVIPRQFVEMISDYQPERAKRVAEAMMTMKKLDIAELQKAYEGE
jgi:predicted 3-demethylubiquinone-9 3-methyltransferase (glyoxalase superfamily)